MKEILLDLGINLAASAVWDIIKSIAAKNPTKEQFTAELSKQLSENQIDISEAEIVSNQIIDFLVSNGALKTIGSRIHSDDQVVQKTSDGGIIFIANSTITTPNSEISTRGNAFIQAKGNTTIEQGPNGIKITVTGKKGDNPGDNSFSVRVSN